MLSSTVADGISTHFGDSGRETANFIRMFDRFFDILNVNNYTTGIHSRKPFKMPFRSKDDFKLKVYNSVSNVKATLKNSWYSGLNKHF